MVSVGSVTVEVVPDARKFNDLLSPQLNQAGKKAGEQVGQDFTDSVQEKVRKSKPVDMPAPDTKKSDAEVDRFLRDFNAKMKKEYDKTGQDSGSALADGLRLSFLRNSPLIAAAVGGGLIAGAPLAIAGAGVLFAGIAAVAEKNNVQLQAATKAAGASISGVFSQAASVTVPAFTSALGRISAAVAQLEPQLHSAFASLGAPINSLTTGVIALAQNAMPGLVSALRNAGPVFTGLSALLGDIGKGLGDFFSQVSQHGALAGDVLSQVGQILQSVLPVLGEFMDVGVQLGSQVLPVLSGVLRVFADVLGAIGPALPAVVAGLGGLMIARSLQGPLGTLSQNLAFASYNSGAFAGAAGKMSTAVSGLSSALPLVGVGVGLVAAVMPGLINLLHEGGAASNEAKGQSQSLTTALQQNKGAIDANIRSMQLQKAQQDGILDYAQKAGISLPLVTQALTGNKGALDQVNTALQAYIDKHPGGIHDKEATGAHNAKNSLNDLAAALGIALTNTGQLDSATAGADTTLGNFKGQLQTTADTASAANTQISLLKGSLDALTGKAVSMGDAQVAVTNATIAAETAMAAQKDQAGHLTSALVDATGHLDQHTAAGAAAWQALTQLSGADNTLISTMEQQGKTSDEVKAKDSQLRDSFIQTAEKMGFSAGEAQNLANEIYGIPAQRNVQINTNAADAKAAIKTVQEQIDNLHGRNVTIAILSAGNAGPAAYAVPGSGTGGLAKGGVIPGYAPGVDSVHAMLSPGEGVLVPEAVRGLGGASAIQAINSAYSSRVPGFATGGVVGSVPVNIHETAQPFNAALQATANKLRDSMNSPYAGAVSGATSQAAVQIGARMAAQAGWTGIQWTDLFNLWMRESGWNPYAVNKSSGAYGIPQSLGHGHPYNLGDSAAQIGWGINYIKGRYGTPASAWAHETSAGWYDQGGLLPPGPSLVYNGTGAPELVAPKQTFEQVMAAAGGAGGAGGIGNMTVIAQFGTETIEATAVRVVTQLEDGAANRLQYTRGGF